MVLRCSVPSFTPFAYRGTGADARWASMVRSDMVRAWCSARRFSSCQREEGERKGRGLEARERGKRRPLVVTACLFLSRAPSPLHNLPPPHHHAPHTPPSKVPGAGRPRPTAGLPRPPGRRRPGRPPRPGRPAGGPGGPPGRGRRRRGGGPGGRGWGWWRRRRSFCGGVARFDARDRGQRRAGAGVLKNGNDNKTNACAPSLSHPPTNTHTHTHARELS